MLSITIILSPNLLNTAIELYLSYRPIPSARLALCRLAMKVEPCFVYGDHMLQADVLLIEVAEISCEMQHAHCKIAWGQFTRDSFFAQFPHFSATILQHLTFYKIPFLADRAFRLYKKSSSGAAMRSCPSEPGIRSPLHWSLRSHFWFLKLFTHCFCPRPSYLIAP